MPDSEQVRISEQLYRKDTQYSRNEHFRKDKSYNDGGSKL